MLAHWDEVEAHRNEKGPMAASWQHLGDAAGVKGFGLNRVRVEPGRLPTPPHSHGLSEEIFFVLGGSGLLWQDEAVCEVRAGDTVVQTADHFEHTFKGGPEGLDYLVFGTRHPVEYGWLPRSKAVRLSWPWVEGRVDNPWEIEAEVGELEFAEPGERPPNVVALDDIPLDEEGDKPLAASAGSERSGLNWVRRDPGSADACRTAIRRSPRRSSSSRAAGVLELWPSPRSAAAGAQREDHELKAGDVVARPPGTRIAHSIVAGPEGITYLVYGTRDPNDICYYPRSNKISFRGVGLIARLDHLDYYDGEPPDG